MFSLLEAIVQRGYGVELAPKDSDGEYRAILRDEDSNFIDDAYGNTVAEALGAVVAELIPNRNEES